MNDCREDFDLLKEAARGSRKSFDCFYQRYESFIYNIAFCLLRDPLEAEDLVQDVFIEIIQKYYTYSPTKGSIKAWIAVKTKSRALDRLRKNMPLLVNRLEDLVIRKEQGADAIFLREIEKDIIWNALNHLPCEQRQAIIRSYFLEETHNEIASSMNKPLGSIKSLIRYGLNNLRKQKPLIQWFQSSRGEEKNEF